MNVDSSDGVMASVDSIAQKVTLRPFLPLLEARHGIVPIPNLNGSVARQQRGSRATDGNDLGFTSEAASVIERCRRCVVT